MFEHTIAASGHRHKLFSTLAGAWLLYTISLGHTVLAGDGALLQPTQAAEDWKLPRNAIDSTQIPEFTLDANASKHQPLPVYRLRNNSYFLYGTIDTLNEKNRGWNGNAGFVVTDAGVLVIDSLGTPMLGHRLIATIRSITEQPIKYLVITHNHPDHAYGAGPFRDIAGIKIIAHQGTLDYNHSATLQNSVDYRREILPADMRGFEPVQADVYIGPPVFGRKQITLGNSHFDIYNTGTHHSYGDLVVHQREQNILWISDLAFNQRLTYMGDGNSAQILRAQDWLMQTFPDVELMVPGHGSAQTPPFPMVRKTHDYVTRMRKAMRQAVADGTSLYDAVQRVEFDDWKQTRLYQQNQKANANFVYREMEQAFFENF